MDSKETEAPLDMLPGSEEAVKAGCCCAVMDNHYGAGKGGDGAKYGWYITHGCSVHHIMEEDEAAEV